LETGTKLGTFEITGLLGKGGMGEVYRATDSKLGRDVAIKVLLESFAADPERMVRFEREAMTLAALNHPNVATVYGFEHDEATGVHYLIMEFIDGETLSERILSSDPSIRDIVALFTDIARGLDAAHEQGIVHRDLKPDNVKINVDGVVKILDFGLAKNTIESKLIEPNAPTTPMSPVAVTAEGTFMGTPMYMSPEQARGRSVDHRTDIWAFGCCLYEALTGDIPFKGDTVADTVGSILKSDPDWSRLPDDVPRELNRLLRRSLEKDQRRRLSSAADCAIALEDLLSDIREGRASSINESAPPLSSTPGAGPIRSLAVLPFENLMGDKEQAYFVDGMTDALTSELSKIKAIKVISRGSAMRYRGTEKSSPQIASELGVEGLIEGSIFRAGDEIRISAQLVDARTDEHVWSENFTGTIDEILQIQNKVTLAIAKEIQVTVSPEEKKQITIRHTTTREVEKLLWEANYQFGRQSTEGYQQSVKLYERAIELDPEYPNSYVGLCAANWVPSVIGVIRPRDGLVKAQEAIDNAMALDENLPSAHLSMGYLAMTYHHDWDRARASFERAIELSPNSAEAHSGLGLLQLVLVEEDEAVRELKHARSLDPMSPMFANNLGLAYLQMGRYEEALEQFTEALELSPHFIMAQQNHAQALFGAGRTQEAIAKFEANNEKTKGLAYSQSLLALCYASEGRKKEAKQIADALVAASKKKYVAPLPIAIAKSATGDLDAALDWAKESIEEREWAVLFMTRGLYLGPIRTDPRFNTLLEELKLPEEARTKILASVQQSAQSAAPVTRARGPVSWVPTFVGLALALLGVFAGFWMNRDSGPQPASIATPTITSLAVLPLRNLSPLGDEDYFAESMTEAITGELAKIKALNIRGRTSAMQYKDTALKIPAIAEALNVDALIEGSVQREGDEVKITVTLQHGVNDIQLWTDSYTETITSVLKLQSDVALAIAEAVNTEITGEERERMADAPDVDPKALEAYLLGQQLHAQQTEASLKSALREFRRATELDESFTIAFVGLATTYLNLTQFNFLPSRLAGPEVLLNARKAIELDDSSAIAHSILANGLWTFEKKWPEADAEFRRALELDPSNGVIRIDYSTALGLAGQSSEARRQMALALEFDSSSTYMRLWSAWTHFTIGDYDDSISIFGDLSKEDDTLEVALEGMGESYHSKGDYPQALEVIKRMAQQRGNDPFARIRLGTAYAATGEIAKAKAILEAESKIVMAIMDDDSAEAQSTPLPFVNLADLYSWVGDYDSAIKWLHVARENMTSEMAIVTAGFINPKLRDDPRFWELLEDMDYPRVSQGHLAYEQQENYRIQKAAREMLREAGGAQIFERIAVLPFENQSIEEGQEFFVNGMTDALTSELQKISNLIVISSSATRSYRDTKLSLKEIADELGVDGLITGSVYRADNNIRITAELTDPETLGSIWSETYDDTMENVIMVQGEATLAIANAIRVAVSDEEQGQIARNLKVAPEAYEAYLKGKEAYLSYTAAGYALAVELLGTAVEIEDGFIDAYAWLSYAHWVSTVWNGGDATVGFENARSATQRALDLDEEAAPGHYTMGWIAMSYDWNWANARGHFQGAARLGPQDPESFNGLASYYIRVGDVDAAIQAGDRANELDPLALQANMNRTRAYSVAGRFDEANEMLDVLQGHYPDSSIIYRFRMTFLIAAGRYYDAIELIDEAIARWGEDAGNLSYKAIALALSGEADDARIVLRRIEMEFENQPNVDTRIAGGYAALKEFDLAFQWLERAVTAHDYQLTELRMDPSLLLLQSDPRYWELCKRIGLPPLPPEHPDYAEEQEWLIKRKAEELIAERGLVPAQSR
jgi:TolB-like protein/predicted Zn-dependent protease